jgi:hypothetical protein
MVTCAHYGILTRELTVTMRYAGIHRLPGPA